MCKIALLGRGVYSQGLGQTKWMHQSLDRNKVPWATGPLVITAPDQLPREVMCLYCPAVSQSGDCLSWGLTLNAANWCDVWFPCFLENAGLDLNLGISVQSAAQHAVDWGTSDLVLISEVVLLLLLLHFKGDSLRTVQCKIKFLGMFLSGFVWWIE